MSYRDGQNITVTQARLDRIKYIEGLMAGLQSEAEAHRQDANQLDKRIETLAAEKERHEAMLRGVA